MGAGICQGGAVHGVGGTVPAVAVGLCQHCLAAARRSRAARARCGALGGSTESSARLDKAGWGAEKAKDGFICSAGIAQAV